ncbi:MAG: hypothetical protein GY795_41670 [Desulfobacterales bacterium]|nr:hypothetical protein [Desulfobacterales bacterium]
MQFTRTDRNSQTIFTIMRLRHQRPFALRLWLFAYSGVTKEAESLLKEHGIYWSDKSDLDWLIQETGLRQLPEFVK